KSSEACLKRNLPTYFGIPSARRRRNSLRNSSRISNPTGRTRVVLEQRLVVLGAGLRLKALPTHRFPLSPNRRYAVIIRRAADWSYRSFDPSATISIPGTPGKQSAGQFGTILAAVQTSCSAGPQLGGH